MNTVKEHAAQILSDGNWHRFENLLEFHPADRRYRDAARILDGCFRRFELVLMHKYDDQGSSWYRLKTVEESTTTCSCAWL